MSRYLVAALAFLHLTRATITHPCLNATTTSPNPTAATNTPIRSKVRASDLLPTASPTSSAATFDLSHSVINQKLFDLHVSGQDIPVHCIECSTAGNLEVFVRDLDDDDDDDTAVPANETALSRRRQQQRRRDLDFDWDIPEGSLNVVFPQGFQGHIELSLTAPSTLKDEVALPSLPLLGVAIPGLGMAGVALSLSIPLELEMTDTANLTFGFNFSLPANASAAIHFPWLDESTSFGFTDTEGLQIDALPIEISTPGLDATLTTGLRLQLDAGISSADKERAVKAGATLDLPRVVVKERQLVHVDDRCHRLPNTNTSAALSASSVAFASPRQGLFNTSNSSSIVVGDYTHLAPSIGVNLDLFAEVDLGPDEILDWDVSPDTTVDIFSTAWALPTICIDNGRDAAATVSAVATSPTPGVDTAPPSSLTAAATSSYSDAITTATVTATSTATVTAALGTSEIGDVVKAAQATATAMTSDLAASILDNGVSRASGCQLPLLVAIAWAVAMF